MIFSRRSFCFTAAALGFGVEIAGAASFVPFKMAEFEAAQKAGKPILVDVAATWCPVCKVQKPVIDKLAAQARFKDLVVFHVDFDADKDVLKALKVTKQSTLIVFKGSKETDRSVGITDEAFIDQSLSTAL